MNDRKNSVQSATLTLGATLNVSNREQINPAHTTTTSAASLAFSQNSVGAYQSCAIGGSAVRTDAR